MDAVGRICVGVASKLSLSQVAMAHYVITTKTTLYNNIATQALAALYSALRGSQERNHGRDTCATEYP